MTDVKEEVGNPNYLNGVFYFSNTSDEDYTHLWNNVEYTFPANSCTPLLIPNQTPEEIQEIRKRFAYDWAQEQWYLGKDYARQAKMGGGLPPLRDDAVLEPLIQKCLSPLPMRQATTKVVKPDGRKYRGSKPVPKNGNLNEQFKDESENVTQVGEL